MLLAWRRRSFRRNSDFSWKTSPVRKVRLDTPDRDSDHPWEIHRTLKLHVSTPYTDTICLRSPEVIELLEESRVPVTSPQNTGDLHALISAFQVEDMQLVCIFLENTPETEEMLGIRKKVGGAKKAIPIEWLSKVACMTHLIFPLAINTERLLQSFSSLELSWVLQK